MTTHTIHTPTSVTSTSASSARTCITVTPIGGPTALVEIDGFRLLLDPTFDPPGTYAVGTRTLEKTIGPALTPDRLGPIDAVLLSHDQHPDNLDQRGRELLAGGLVLTTPAAAQRLGGQAIGLSASDRHVLTRTDGSTLTIIGTPARHGPEGTEHLTGPVTGFVVRSVDATVYVSGDNASLDVVAEIARIHAPFDLAILFAGGAQTPLLGDAFLTLSSDRAAVASLLLGAPPTVVVHTDGWGHFTQSAATLPAAFGSFGILDRLLLAEPGRRIEI